MDIDGDGWANPPAVGCDQPSPLSATGALSVAVRLEATQVVAGTTLSLVGLVTGVPTSVQWQFGDGCGTTNSAYVAHAWTNEGAFDVVFTAYNITHDDGVAITGRVHVVALEQTVRYVSTNSLSPAPPYDSWSNAAHTIQEAVDAQQTLGGLVLVTDGVYRVGATGEPSATPNRLAILRKVTVRSVNGPTVTSIEGAGPNGNSAVRCVYLVTGRLEGFALMNGHTRTVGEDIRDMYGGGILADQGEIVNCHLATNQAYIHGGGGYGGRYSGCVFSGNRSIYGAGVSGAALADCVLIGNLATIDGGASADSIVERCELIDNSASRGGGAWRCVLTNSFLRGNYASWGGGTFTSLLYNCTLLSNGAVNGGAVYAGSLVNCRLIENSASNGGGAMSCNLRNCEVRGNQAQGAGGGTYASVTYNCTLVLNAATRGGACYAGSNMNSIVYANKGDTQVSSTFDHCSISAVLPGGPACITGDPRLISFTHLAADSPCRGAGASSYAAGVDLDGESWGTPPSIGCDEVLGYSATGALSVEIVLVMTQVAVGASVPLVGRITGVPASNIWQFGDAQQQTNTIFPWHIWATPGVYNISLTAFNADQPGGVSAAASLVVVPPESNATYAWTNSPAPSYPYDSWSNAAHNLQDAVDAQGLLGGWVIVTDGVYRTGSRVTPGGTLTNRLVVTNDVLVMSVGGASATSIEGLGPVGNTAIRCVYASAGELRGFTLTNGATRSTGDQFLDRSGGGTHAVGARLTECRVTRNLAREFGGGAYGGDYKGCDFAFNTSSNQGGGAYAAVLTNCTVAGNSSPFGGGVAACSMWGCRLQSNTATSGSGGGAWNSTGRACRLWGNRAALGGGAAYGTLLGCALWRNVATTDGGGLYNAYAANCTIVANDTVGGGGGAAGCDLEDCIVYYNRAGVAPNTYFGYAEGCCLFPPGWNEVNPLMSEPGLLSYMHLSAGSPCVGRGQGNSPYAADIDGDAWGWPPVIGCDEPRGGTATGALHVTVIAETTQTVSGYRVRLIGETVGVPSAVLWDLGDGTSVSNSAFITHQWGSTGTYQIVFTVVNDSNPMGVSTNIRISVLDAVATATYVSTNSPAPAPPYNSWSNAARTIQAAVDAQMLFGGLVLVDAGTYDVGSRATPAASSLNRVVITNEVRVRSVNGPQFTTIRGFRLTNAPANNVRCVYMSAGRLEGFTLTGGGTLTGGVHDLDRCGGGVNARYQAVVSNCVIAGNVAHGDGGGANFGVFHNCQFVNNRAGISGGVDWGELHGCTLVSNSVSGLGTHGGGMGGGWAFRSLLLGNTAPHGGGAHFARLHDSVIAHNNNFGATQCRLVNCSVISNASGVGFSDVQNSIVYYNSNANWSLSGSIYTFTHSCTWPFPPGGNNLTNAPLFLAPSSSNYCLQFISPGVNAGQLLNGTPYDTDFAGRPRMADGVVDLGAFESSADGDGDGLSDVWEQHYGGGLTNLWAGGDWDGDGLSDMDEQRAGTNPADATSNLRIVAVDADTNAAGVVVRWASAEGRTYALRAATNALERVPLALQTNLAATAPLNVLTDSAPAEAVRFYGVELQYPP